MFFTLGFEGKNSALSQKVVRKPGGQGGNLVDNLQLEDVVTIKTDSPASDVRHTALAWSPLADGRDGETAVRCVETGTCTVS